jgi:hypothetical protein
MGYVLLIVASCVSADSRPTYQPLSLPYPPAVIKGITATEIIAAFKKMSEGSANHPWRLTSPKCMFCPYSGTYYWQVMSLLSERVESYTGKEDVVRVQFHFGLSDSSLMEAADKARIVSAAHGEEISTFIKDSVLKLKKMTSGRRIPTNNALFNEECKIVGDVHVRVQTYNVAWLSNISTEVNVAITGVEERTWTDATGEHKVVAAYVSHDDRQLRLLKGEKEITVPLRKVSPDDLTWLGYLQGIETRGVEQDDGDSTAKEKADGKATEEKQIKRKRWLNETYKQTIYQVQGKRWSEINNSTRQLTHHLTELKRTDEYVELNGFFFGVGRLCSDRLLMKKQDKWEWASTGHWTE